MARKNETERQKVQIFGDIGNTYCLSRSLFSINAILYWSIFERLPIYNWVDRDKYDLPKHILVPGWDSNPLWLDWELIESTFIIITTP